MPYAKSCGCNQYSQGMVCGKTPAGKISCSFGTSFPYQCKSWLQGNNDSGKGCVVDSNCVSCPTAKPNYPVAKCDYEKKQCVKSYECGVNECGSNGDCCGKPGESNPHYVCDTTTYKCSLSKTCGKNECNPNDDVYSKNMNAYINPKCQKYSCNIDT